MEKSYNNKNYIKAFDYLKKIDDKLPLEIKDLTEKYLSTFASSFSHYPIEDQQAEISKQIDTLWRITLDTTLKNTNEIRKGIQNFRTKNIELLIL